MAEKAKLKAWHTKDVKRFMQAKIDESSVYALALRPDAKVIAAAGGDGIVRFIDTATGALTHCGKKRGTWRCEILAEERSDHRQASARTRRDRRERVPKVVDPHVIDASRRSDALPGVLKVNQWLAVSPSFPARREHVRIARELRLRLQQRHCRRVQPDNLDAASAPPLFRPARPHR